jgi:hypothetical protein
MTTAELLLNLDAVRRRGAGRWSARCPAHSDNSPSLSIREGDRGILLKCWAGCTLEEITAELGLRVTDLFFDAGLSDSTERRLAMQRRAQERAAKDAAYQAEGRQLDLQRDAEAVIRTAQGIDISNWSDEQLDAGLNRLADAYAACPRGEPEYEW